MEAYRIENLTFSYPTHKNPALQAVDLLIEQGAFVTLCGLSGCGKTTLLRHLKPSVTPHGQRTGRIFFEHTPLEALSARDAVTKIGFVSQSPDNQIVTDKVWHELAFGLENLGKKTSEIRLRVAEMASFFGIQTWFHKSVSELSGGQKQILALASVMTLQPSVLILDEPTSQLDPIAAGEFLAAVEKINRDLGITIILTEHRLEEAFPISSYVAVMDDGCIVEEGSPDKLGLNHRMSLALPTAMRVWAACGGAGKCPVTVREGAAWLGNYPKNKYSTEYRFPEAKMSGDVAANAKLSAIFLDDIWFRYEKNQPDVIKGLSFKAYYGEISAILGGNGTGKTTMLSLIAGLDTPYRGNIKADSAVHVLPQNPQSLFVGQTVREDLLEIEGENKRFDDIVNLCRLEGLLDNHPYDLSGGEQQRAALAKVLLIQPKILLLDEPTKGLDAEFKKIFAAILRKMTDTGVAVVMVSHDVEFCAEYADCCALFFDGSIVTQNTTREFFAGNGFYTTSANRMARHIMPKAITAADIIQALGGEEQPVPPIHKIDFKYKISESSHTEAPIVKLQKPKHYKRIMLLAAIIFLTIPLTIFLGTYLFNDRQFYVISMLVILQTMIPFFIIFEGRKPQARELVVVAVLCAIAVAGRAAFFMLPQFKPVAAVVIIAGVAFGAETGFLVGAMTAFVSNMFFGQGPWTPWQMFAFGMIGFLAGVIFRKGRLIPRPAPLAVFGGLATFLIYGGIMNPTMVLMFQPNPTIEMFILAYMYGIPFDLVHAAASVVFLALISRPMLQKLKRIKVKYGLVSV